MAINRFFYVSQDSLTVWIAAESSLSEQFCFPQSSDGYAEFSAYLQRAPDVRSLLVADVIEEEFDTDSIPDLSGSDRKSLIERRLAKRYSVTPYRLGVFQGRRRRESDRFNTVFSAITNRELLDPWMEAISNCKVPLVGVTSLPLIATDFLRKFRKPAENSLLLSQHQGARLRQVFIKSGQPISARLSRSIQTEPTELSKSIVDEVSQSRKYLERSRYLDRSDSLDVYLIADSKNIESSLLSDESIDCRVHLLDSTQIASKLGLSSGWREGHLESLFLAYCSRKKPGYEYKISGRTDYSTHKRVRQFALGLATTGAIACSAAVGFFLMSGLKFGDTSQGIESQIMHLEETYRRDHAEFESVQADSHEMKLAVDTGNYIIRNTLPVEWVMSQIGLVLDDHADMHVRKLSWSIESEEQGESDSASANRRDKTRPVPIPRINAVKANLIGEVRPYDGDLNRAFEKIDRLASSLQEQSAFDRVAVVEYPIDARPAVSVSGEVRRAGGISVAQFNLSLSLRVSDEPG